MKKIPVSRLAKSKAETRLEIHHLRRSDTASGIPWISRECHAGRRIGIHAAVSVLKKLGITEFADAILLEVVGQELEMLCNRLSEVFLCEKPTFKTRKQWTTLMGLASVLSFRANKRNEGNEIILIPPPAAHFFYGNITVGRAGVIGTGPMAHPAGPTPNRGYGLRRASLA